MATPTPAQKQMNARVALEQAIDYYESRTVSGRLNNTAQVTDVIAVATRFADFLDGRA